MSQEMKDVSISQEIEFLKGTALHSLCGEYLSWDQNTATKQIVKQLVSKRDVDSLKKILESRLQFGTAGLRGKMGPGFNAMNDLVIIQTTQGFLAYLETIFSAKELTDRGIVVGYDGRHNSHRFALRIANTFLQKGYAVYLFSKICPTPFVPFAVKMFGGCAGIMVTASHNPKEDNGYKVYWENGAQIISPHDKGIQSFIMENLKPWPKAWELNPKCDPYLFTDAYEEVVKNYYTAVCEDSLGVDHGRNGKCKVKFAYTPMHGVGQAYMELGFKMANLPPFVSVELQKEADPEFPTVKFPNPEEGKSALNLAIQTANENQCTVILANDPDADRLAVAEKLSSGEWKIFNGNEIGALLGWWCLHTYVEEHGRSDLNNCYMISSTVSSKILRTMAEKEGFQFRETLTGFKWMANLADQLMADEKTVLFAFEEAIGFMCSTTVLDKDGISAGVRVAEMASHLADNGLTLNDQLVKIYETYGFHVSKNAYYLCYEPETINKMFHDIRVFNDSKEEGNYPSHLFKGKYKVTSVRDLTTGFDSSEPDKLAKLPVSRGSHMLTFTFDNGLVATLRTSGTEPKIKYYTELCSSPSERDWNVVRKTLDEMVAAMIHEWIQPEKWGLAVPREEEADEEREVRSA